MRKTKTVIFSVLIALAIIAPPALVVIVNIALPNPYVNNFTAALDEKYERLVGIDEAKVVVLGGSSVAFGIDSGIIEEYTGMPTVNFGLYAALGTKLMLDLSRPHISDGDIVILTPEIDAQTFSLYFSADNTLKALEGHSEMLRPIPIENKLSLLGGLWRHTADKLSYYLADEIPDPSGVYNANNFDERGDLAYPRTENVMTPPDYFDRNNMIKPDADIISDDFIDYVNEYIEEVEARGATVYFNFCPMNELGFAEGYTEDDLILFAEYIEEKFDTEVLGTPTASVMEAGYFYDSNFHLNDAGVIAYTVRLTEDILFEIGSPRAVKVDVPEAPPLPLLDVYIDLYDENEVYFEFTETDIGTYEITGLTELGKTMSELTIPSAYNKRKVTVLGQGALDGACAAKIIIPENTTLLAIEDGAFLGASSVTELWIYFTSTEAGEERISPPSAFVGVGAGFVVHVPSVSGYTTDYFWAERGVTFITDADR